MVSVPIACVSWLILVVLVVVAPVLPGSSQLLNRVEFVPPPVHDMSNLPYSPIEGICILQKQLLSPMLQMLF